MGKENSGQVNKTVDTPAEKKASVPKERGKLASREEKNFVKQNKVAKIESKKVEEKEEEKKPKSYGKVPKYLQKINQQREDEKAKVRAALEDKDCPAGCM